MIGRWLVCVSALSVSLGALACSSSSDDDDGAGSGAINLGPYPEGPYGHEVGETIDNLQWEGYVNDTAVGLANAQPFVPYSMDDIRESGKAYALVHISEFW